MFSGMAPELAFCHRHRRPRIMGSKSKLRPNCFPSPTPCPAALEKQKISRARYETTNGHSAGYLSSPLSGVKTSSLISEELRSLRTRVQQR